MNAIITLTTDFGLTDAYVAAMKGVILGINPKANIIDICHAIAPQNISQAAFVLNTAYKFFPERTVHVVVVDPGVGTGRRAIILRTPQFDFIAPDNGVLSYVIEPFLKQWPGPEQGQVTLPPELKAVSITKPEFWRTPVSPTFHGRDIFAPIAARLSLGASPETFGEVMNSVTVLPETRPHQESADTLLGRIVHIDNFGNLITNFKHEDLPQKPFAVEVSNRSISGLSRTYAEGEELLALIGSSGYLEIAVKGGSALDFLGVAVGGEVRIKLGKR
ncbi:MAG: SAM-dependent chlorinase/fluorinase [Chloroflexi bacterium]|nr:SAM-dependent chlorinase/fluorinase [Chloroflexota bacterium]